MNEHSLDLVIIGGGPAGYIAAIRAAQLGLKTALVDKRPSLGGTCLNIGCIPSKALLTSSDHWHFIQHQAASHGIHADDLRFDLSAMLARKDKVVRTLSGGVDLLIKKNGIARYRGIARVTAPGIVDVDVENEQPVTLRADRILLATGSVPVELPQAPFNGGTIVSSTEALSFTEVPRQLAVIGAGAIGLEMASIWRRLGAEVTVIEFLPRIAPGCDADIAIGLQRALEKQGIRFHLEASVTSVDSVDGRPVVRADCKGQPIAVDADRVLVAVGRRPYADGLFPHDNSPETDKRGRFIIDAHYQTTLAGIFAVGDLVQGPMLAHKAEEEGVACVERMAGKAGHVNYDVIPGIVYTNPEAASVGITEEQAGELGMKIRTGRFPYAANGRALAGGDTTGFVKLIACAATDRLLGAHILSPHASELIAEIVTLMEYRGSAEDLARIIHGHPTLSEATREAALAVDGRAIHITRS